MRRPTSFAALALAVIGLVSGTASARAEAYPGADQEVAAARALFEKNLAAIADKDREAYLSCYHQSPRLARTGPAGIALGYDGLAASAGEGWPDVFEAQDLELVPLRPGVVYGTYRYRVAYGDDEQTGLSERVFLDTEGGWRIAVSTAFGAPEGEPPPRRALVGATLVDGTGADPVEDASVVLGGGRIVCAGSREECPVPEGVGTVDLAGHFLAPGLVDAHVHFSQTGWADGRPDSMDVRDLYPYVEVQKRLRDAPGAFLSAHLCSGVTSVFDVGGYPWTWDLMRRSEADTRGPRVVATGPLLSTVDFPLNLPAERQFIHLASPDAAREGVAYLASRGAGAVKIWFILGRGADLEVLSQNVAAAGEAAREHGLRLVVHATGLASAKAAIHAGADVLVHSVYEEPVDDEFVELAASSGVVYIPTLTVLDGYRRMYADALAGAEPAIDDPNGCIDQGTRERLARTAELADRVSDRGARLAESDPGSGVAEANLAPLAEAGVTIAMGTDAGNPLTLHGPSVYAEMEAMQAAGMSAMEVLKASTLGGAMALGRAEELGTIEAGKLADLIVVASDPSADVANLRQITHVVRGGVLRPIAELVAAQDSP